MFFSLHSHYSAINCNRFSCATSLRFCINTQGATGNLCFPLSGEWYLDVTDFFVKDENVNLRGCDFSYLCSLQLAVSEM